MYTQTYVQRKTFTIDKGYYSYIAVATVLEQKITVRYYWVYDCQENVNKIVEITESCAETIALEKKVRKWAEKNDYIMWSY
jgi:hypothetical protein